MPQNTPDLPPFNPDDIVHRRTIENHRVELKSTWNAKIGASLVRTVCAFANDLLHLNGGYIVLGIEEKEGRPVLPPSGLGNIDLERVQKELFGFCKRIHPEYQPYCYPLELEGRMVLIVWAPGGENRPYQAPENAAVKGSPMQSWVRTGPQTIKARGEVLRQLIELTAKVPFDDRRHLSAHVENISPLLVRRFLQERGVLRKRGTRLIGQEQIDDHDLYRKLRLLKQVNAHEVPRNFALLFFNEGPDQFFPGAKIVVARFPEGAAGDTIEEREFRGPLDHQIKLVLNYLQGLNGTLIRKVHGEAEAQHTVAYPFEAVEELIVNAVHHRGYDGPPEPIKIHLYPEQMMVTSYPGPVPGLRLEHFHPDSVVPPVAGRNRRIGELLKDLELAEVWGSGIPKIQESLRVNGSPAAKFDFDEETRTYFTATLPIHPDYRPTLHNYPSGQDGLIMISLGAESIRPGVERSLEGSGLRQAKVLLDLALSGYVEPLPEHWEAMAKRIRNAVKKCIDEPGVERLHLFYHGPLAIAPLIGALTASSAKPTLVYHYDKGRYNPAYTMDRRFLIAKD